MFSNAAIGVKNRLFALILSFVCNTKKTCPRGNEKTDQQ